jgi:hypothetical protein
MIVTVQKYDVPNCTQIIFEIQDESLQELPDAKRQILNNVTTPLNAEAAILAIAAMHMINKKKQKGKQNEQHLG